MSRNRYLLPLGFVLSAMLPAVADAGATWTYLYLEANFRCDNGVTAQGYSVYAVGNVAELGNWDTEKAVLLGSAAYPSWSAKIKFTKAKPGDVIEWKCIIRNEKPPYDVKTWQSGPDNQVTMTFSASLQTTGQF
ncbi:carbohydrate-binding module family 20 domain-containing protein [Pseudomonas neuropathica]|jgi:alpha-amylase